MYHTSQLVSRQSKHDRKWKKALENKNVNFANPMVKGKVQSSTKRNAQVRKVHFYCPWSFLTCTVFNFPHSNSYMVSKLLCSSMNIQKYEYNKRSCAKKLTQDTTFSKFNIFREDQTSVMGEKWCNQSS